MHYLSQNKHLYVEILNLFTTYVTTIQARKVILYLEVLNVCEIQL